MSRPGNQAVSASAASTPSPWRIHDFSEKHPAAHRESPNNRQRTRPPAPQGPANGQRGDGTGRQRHRPHRRIEVPRWPIHPGSPSGRPAFPPNATPAKRPRQAPVAAVPQRTRAGGRRTPVSHPLDDLDGQRRRRVGAKDQGHVHDAHPIGEDDVDRQADLGVDPGKTVFNQPVVRPYPKAAAIWRARAASVWPRAARVISSRNGISFTTMPPIIVKPQGSCTINQSGGFVHPSHPATKPGNPARWRDQKGEAEGGGGMRHAEERRQQAFHQPRMPRVPDHPPPATSPASARYRRAKPGRQRQRARCATGRATRPALERHQGSAPSARPRADARRPAGSCRKPRARPGQHRHAASAPARRQQAVPHAC